MPKQEGQKTKLLALLHIFEQKTDENHLLNVPQLVELLEQQGILAERKSIYSDIDTLCALGYDIQLRRGRGGGYWMASRAFELSELKLLVDAVQASKVISARTSKKLIRKLEALCSEYEGTQLQRQVYVDGRPKADSRTLLYSIDALHTAISAGRLVQFRYKNNSTWTVSPWQLAWEGGCYYLIAYQDEKDPANIRNYRVDRMSYVKVLDRPRRGHPAAAHPGGQGPERHRRRAGHHGRREPLRRVHRRGGRRAGRGRRGRPGMDRDHRHQPAAAVYRHHRGADGGWNIIRDTVVG